MYNIKYLGILQLENVLFEYYQKGKIDNVYKGKLEEIINEYREPTDIDVCEFLERKLNEKLEDTFSYFFRLISYGPGKNWEIDDGLINEFVIYCNEKFPDDKKYEIFALDNGEKIKSSDIGLWINNYIDSLCSYYFNYDYIKKFSDYN